MNGLKIFSLAFAKVWSHSDLRRWYFKTLVLTMLIAATIIVGIFFLGSWALSSYVDNNWYAGAAMVVWVLVLFYLGGQIATICMNAMVMIVGGESAVTRFYLSKSQVAASPPNRKFIGNIKLYKGEVFSMLRTLLVACVAWPLFLIPLLMPLGVLIFAWTMAGDAMAVSKRMLHVAGLQALQDREKVSVSSMIGVGLLPSSLALFPVLGWALLPILQVAGVEFQLQESRSGKKLRDILPEGHGEDPKA